MKQTRRQILKQSALASGSFFIASSQSACGKKSDAIRMAVVGFRGRGPEHIKAWSKSSNARLVALCDVNKTLLETQAGELKKQGTEVAAYQDIRKLLESKDVDAISIATPNHWHALAAIWAMQAGKDVYVEKPASHNVWEGRQLVNAARKYQKIAQVGSQCRSSTSLKEAIEWVKAGHIGKITIARGLCYKRRQSIGKTTKPLAVGPEVDLDLWLGPAPQEEIHRKKLDYDWHWQWPYGNGDLGNQGVHQMDIARWFLGENEMATEAWSVGGRLGYEDDGDTPNTQIVYQNYKAAPLIFEVRGLPASTSVKDMDQFMGAGIGCVIHCEGGYIVIPSYTEATAYDMGGDKLKTWKESESHFENFLKAVKSRNPKDLNAEVLEGHISAAICHTGNISYRLGEKKSVEDIRKTLESQRGAVETLDRMVKHLEANSVNLKETPLTLGPTLAFDPKAEKAIGNEAAAKLMTREYRAPFVVPEISATS
jgi:predicted dehydrogenase